MDPKSNRGSRTLRIVRLGAALAFAAACLLYTTVWTIAVTHPAGVPPVELGFDNPYVASERAFVVTGIRPNSPALRAGLAVGDRIVAIDGTPVGDDADLATRVWMQRRPGDPVRLTVRRRGSPSPLELTGIFRARASASFADAFSQQIRNSYPLPFIAVGLVILFLRLDDGKVWLMALLFAGFAVTPGTPANVATLTPRLAPFMVGMKALFTGSLGTLFYWFFSVFPARSPIDRRWPWLKWAVVPVGLSIGLPGMRNGALALPAPLAKWLAPELAARVPVAIVLGLLGLGLVSLMGNYAGTKETQPRRKIRVIFWATLFSIVPTMVVVGVQTLWGYRTPDWLDRVLNVMQLVLPLSFAYAVVKHRVLEIPALLRRSARYLLVQRGFTVVLSLVSIGLTLAFAVSFARRVAEPSGIALGAVFGTVLLWGGSQVHRNVSGRIDRAFFRSAYDARRILEDLADKSRAAKDRPALAGLLRRHITEALRPAFLRMYFLPAENELHTPGAKHIVAELVRRGEPWELPPDVERPAPLDGECLVPVFGAGGVLLAVLVLGPRLSEEPYSSEDRRLLASVASQAGMALENIGLAEEIAERMESERRIQREMEIAREVQTRLLPQTMPRLKTVEFAAKCIQARSVGGDCYDFFELEDGRTGFVLADIAGKGVHAALLMANLQAHLRSRSSLPPVNPVRILEQVNGVLWKSTAAQHYATLFYGIYDDRARELLYVNCGHLPPFRLRAHGSAERLAPTATVIGAFPAWTGEAARVQLAPGDLLAVFSDGVTEQARGDDEFGDARLLDELRRQSGGTVDGIVEAILARVQEFGEGAQSDDLTLLVARIRT